MTEHESGQTRIDAPGDQLSVTPLPDEAIPSQPVTSEAFYETLRRAGVQPDRIDAMRQTERGTT